MGGFPRLGKAERRFSEPWNFFGPRFQGLENSSGATA
jgi:hypothetical protein